MDVRVCLVSAPSIAEFWNLDSIGLEATPRIPLGVLSLAGELERGGIRPEIADLDVFYTAWRAMRGRTNNFARHAAARLAALGAEVYGLSTMCGSYPLTLRIASALKEARPGCRIVLGGPQATATAEETLNAFPAVDIVVRGEGEHILPELLVALAAARDLSAVRGIVFRTSGGVARTADAALLDDMDSLPLPTYGPYLQEQRYGSVPLEVGRGCPFACTFCSTSMFFGRRFRMKSPARIVEDMLTLRRAYGTRSFDLVHDNFTVDRKRVVAFCEAVSSAAARFRWTCSSRTDTLDDDLVHLMRKAGCRGVFLGVESGSEAIQQSVNKRLDLTRARTVVEGLSREKVRATLSFVTGFPDERPVDLQKTVLFFVDALRHDFLEPQLTLLSPLAGTPLHVRHKHELVLDQIVSDIAFQGDKQDAGDRALIRDHPEIFSSYYSVPTRWLDRGEVNELRLLLIHARLALRWLLVAAAQLEGGGIEAFRAFRAWRLARGRVSPKAADDFLGAALRADFVRFVREDLARRHPAAGHALRSLARYYRGVELRARSTPARSLPVAGPSRAHNVFLTPISCDGAALIRCLRVGGDLASVPRRRSVLVTRELPTHDQLVHISEEAAEILRLCDGTRSVDAIARSYGRRHPIVGGIRGDTAARISLELFLRRGLVTWPRAQRRASRARPSSRPGAAGRRPRPSSA
jgi:radical SAM superfamily enzyme YgiQ (UPF0313 family)